MIILKETNPDQFTIVSGHGEIGIAMANKETKVHVLYDKQSGQRFEGVLNLSTYQLEKLILSGNP